MSKPTLGAFCVQGPLRAAYLSGRCADGAQRDGGRRYHLVPQDRIPWGRALCGAKPGRTSGCGFVADDRPATCARCLKRQVPPIGAVATGEGR